MTWWMAETRAALPRSPRVPSCRLAARAVQRCLVELDAGEGDFLDEGRVGQHWLTLRTIAVHTFS
jgi:hypothetical protein